MQVLALQIRRLLWIGTAGNDICSNGRSISAKELLPDGRQLDDTDDWKREWK
jgi:hypothetical protein